MQRPGPITVPRGLALILISAAAVAAVCFRDELPALWAWINQSPPAVLAAALILLPAVGFPLSPLLVLLGVRFGWVPGLAALAAVVPLHMMAAFWISRKVLYRRLSALARRRGMDLTALPLSGRIKAGLVFMALPAFSYTLKNHLLPLSGLPAGYCLALGWPVQVLFGIPFVIFGSAASTWSLPLAAGAVGMTVLFLAASGPLVRIYNRLTQTRSDKKEKTP